jgi:hypothetical protein
MLIRHIDFPVRPSIEKGESLAGYICRFHIANGHRMPFALYKALQSMYRGTPGRAATAFDIVQSVVGDSVALDRTQWPDIRLIERRSRAWRILTCTPAHFCPACLREYGFHFALWELPLVQACPLHRTALLTKCSRCQKPLSWPLIYPAWRCRCGQSIATMTPEPANKGAVAIARCFAEAEDVVQQDSFRKCLGEPVNEGYGLNDAYGGLEWIGDLRNAFMKSGPNPRKASDCQRLLIGRSWPNAWDVKLLADSPEQTVVRLLKVLRKHFRANESMLCVIEKFDSLNSAILSTYVAWDRSVFERKIHRAVDHILSEYNPKLPISSIVLYNPWFSSDRRTKNLTQFMSWWNSLSKRMEDLDPEIQSYQRNIASLPRFCNQLQAIEIVDVLNILIDAALQQINMEKFWVLLYWWRIPKTLREFTEPSEALSQIGSYLMMIPDYEARFVCSLVHLAWEGYR